MRWFVLLVLGVLGVGACSDARPEATRVESHALTGAPAWFERQKLLPNVSSVNGRFGTALALSGDTAIIGAPFAAPNNVIIGAAYVFVRDATGAWSQQQILTAPDGATLDQFGASVALFGNRALVGAPGDDNESGTDAGAAYLFTRVGAVWSLEKKLLAAASPTDVSVNAPAPNDQFGVTVALDADTALVGAPHHLLYNDLESGAIYSFAQLSSGWAQSQVLKVSNKNGHLGHAMALAQNVLAFSVDPSTVVANPTVVVFYWSTKSGATWPSARGMAIPAPSGSVVALSESYTLIKSDSVGVPGRVFVCTADNSGISHQLLATLSASDGTANDGFGSALAVSGGTLLIGNASGAVYVFSGSDSTWKQVQKLAATDGQATDGFGSAVAVAGTVALVGAPVNLAQGAVYAEEFGDGYANGTACAVAGQCQSGFCVEHVCCNSACSGNKCQSCLAVNTGNAAGVCDNVLTGTDPLNGCAVAAASSCGLDGQCDGHGACELYAKGTVCGSHPCVTSTSVMGSPLCDGLGSCITSPTPAACLLGYVCQINVCAVSCSSSAQCDVKAGYECIAAKCVETANGEGGAAGSAGAENAGGGGSGASSSAGASGARAGAGSDDAGATNGGAAAIGNGGAAGEPPSEPMGSAGSGTPSAEAGSADAGAASSGNAGDPAASACGCRAAGGASAASAPPVLALLLGYAALRRRRRPALRA